MSKKNRVAKRLWLALFLVLAMVSVSQADYVINNLPERIQEHSNWCWAGSSQSILNYYEQTPTQSQIANYAWGRSDCSGSTVFSWNHPCNRPNCPCCPSSCDVNPDPAIVETPDHAIDGILAHWGVSSNMVYDHLTETTVKAESDAHRPFVMRFGWTSGGGHFLVGRGYIRSGTTGYVYYMDPWLGNGYTFSTYNWVKSSDNHHDWTHTLKITTPGEAVLYMPKDLTINNLTPTYEWFAVPGATWYELWVQGTSGTVFRKWLSSSDYKISGGYVSYRPSMTLPNGNYKWGIRTYSSNGYGPWSDWASFKQGAGGTPKIDSPVPGSTLSGSTEIFSWSANGASVTKWWLYVGSYQGGADIHNSGDLGTELWDKVYGIPTDGSKVYVKLWYYSGGWKYVEAQYKAATITVTPKITIPVPATTLSGSTVNFGWKNNGVSVSQWWLYVGSSLGGSDIYNSGSISAGTRSRTVSGIPTDGSKVYVKLWYYSGGWKYVEAQYKAATITVTPKITIPVPATTLSGSTVNFGWKNNGVSVSQWWLYVGSSLGGSDIYNSGSISAGTRSRTVSGIPTDGSKVYVKLWYYSGGWKYVEAQYKAATTTCGFNEQFNSGNAANWRRDSGFWNVVSSAWYYTPGVNGKFATSTYNDTYSNVDYRARFWRSATNTLSNRLLVRASGAIGSDGSPANAYLFQYSTAGSWDVGKYVGGVWTTLKYWTASSYINKGAAWNELRAHVSGSRLYFYINGHMVWSGTDYSLSSGRVGVGMYKSTSSDGALWVDYATLRCLSDADEDAGEVSLDEISDEQQELNAAEVADHTLDAENGSQ